MSTYNEMKNPGKLSRAILVLMFVSLIGMFVASFMYRHANPSLVKHLNAAPEQSSSAAGGMPGGGATPEAMQHIADLMGQLKETPNSYELRLEVAQHFMEVSQWASAAVHLEKALEMKPDELPVYMHLAYCRFNLEDYEAAAKHYEKAVEISGDANAKVNLAYIYKFHLNRAAEADAMFDAVINSDSNEGAKEMAKALRESQPE